MNYLERLRTIFKQPDLYQAHRDAAPVLVEASKDQEFLHWVLKKNLSDPAYLNKTRHYPTISFPIEENETFTMVANTFLPLPNGDTEQSFQSIHHHGKLLLSTVSAFGPGYESMIFKGGYSVDETSGLTNMQLERLYQNQSNNIEFVDAFVPHVVFYPTTASMTFALWSSGRHEALSKVKKLGALQKVKKPLKAILQATGLASAAGINKIDFNDFYPADGQIYGMRNRIGYPEGSNENWLQNVFSLVQQMGLTDADFLNQLKADCVARNQPAPIPWIDKVLEGTPIDLKFEPSHLNIDKVNLHKQDILAVYQGSETANS